jgi:hypothetical protein
VDFGDKVYGHGNSRFMSASAKVPEGSDGIPLDQGDEIIQDGIDLYFTAWQAMLQTRYATGEIDGNQFAKETAAFKLRIERVKALYKRVGGYSNEELKQLIQSVEAKEKEKQPHV